MQIDRTGLWVLLGVTCAGGLVQAVRVQLLHGFYARHAGWRDAPGSFLGTCIDVLFTGLGFGMLAACVIVGLAAVLEKSGLAIF
jgi:hypothetical protein